MFQSLTSFFKKKPTEIEESVLMESLKSASMNGEPDFNTKMGGIRTGKKSTDFTFWDRVRMGWQAFKIARKLPHGLITHWDTELDIPAGILPSEFEEGLNRSCKLSIRYVDYLGKENVVRIYPFRPF